MAQKRLAWILVLLSLTAVGGFVLRWRRSGGGAPSHPVGTILVKSAGDPFYQEAQELHGASYLGLARPGHVTERFSFIAANLEHRVEISNLLWSVLTMEADSRLHFSAAQVARMLPLVERSARGYERAVAIERALPRFVTAPQLAYLQEFAQTPPAQRDQMEARVTWKPRGRCPPRLEYFVWRTMQLLRDRLGPRPPLRPDRWYWRSPAPPSSDVVAIPDFYCGLMMMMELRPDLNVGGPELRRLDAVSRDLAHAILDYESFTQTWRQVFRPEQSAFLLSKVAILNHVFPP